MTHRSDRLPPDMLAMGALMAFRSALRAMEEADGDAVDKAVARWVASALHGCARGFRDRGDLTGAAAIHSAACEAVRDLASGRWREDVMEALKDPSMLVRAEDL